MSNRPTCDVDVVIPVFNTERYIAGALRSVLNQSKPPRRVVVVDDGSTDASAARIAEVIASYSGPTTVDCIRKLNGGLSSARNFGIARCTSRYVAFLDADDVWEPAKLETQLRVFETSAIERLGLVYCAYHVIGTEGEPLPDEPVVEPDEALRGDVFALLLEANRVSGSGSGVLILKSELDAAGDFDEELKAAEDWDMWLRLSQRCSFDYAAEDLVAIRRHGASMQADKQHMLANLLRFFMKWFPE
ncbi:MAG TPA: glycosyltransferase, partial [Flavobacteriales bacterium]|nr:glycosyltransferase [Flavobacteriales bacterium]